MEFISFFYSISANCVSFLVFFTGEWFNSVLCLILAYLNDAIIVFCVMMFCIIRYIFDEKGSSFTSSFLEFFFFPWCASFSSPEGLFSMLYFIIEFIIEYIYAWMVGALEWNKILYVKEIWHSVYSNLYVDSDVSIAAENCPEKHTRPDLDQEKKSYSESQWKEAYVIFAMSFSLTVIAVVLFVHFTHK